VRPSIGNFFEVGFSKRLLSTFRVDAAHFRRTMTNFADDDLLLNTGVSFPIAFRRADIRGTLTKAWIADGLVFEQFGSDKPRTSITPPIASHNFMYYRGGTLRFGKLIMVDVDLMLVDDDPKDPFDFSPAGYKDQLVAGYSKNTPENGLVTHMPDLSDITKRGR
jgi:hypothetical protein